MWDVHFVMLCRELPVSTSYFCTDSFYSLIITTWEMYTVC